MSTTTAQRPPRTLTLDVAGIPKELRERDQWVCWRWKLDDNKWTKVPINPRTGMGADTGNPNDWGPISVALYWLKQHGDQVAGIGYVFAEDDPYCGIDLDKARDPQTGQLAPWAQAITDRFDSYAEWSITGSGVHIVVIGKLPVQKSREKGRPIEVYDRKRFFVMSGQPIRNAGYIGDRQDELEAWHRETFPKAYAPKPAPRPASTEPLGVDDDAILQACMGNEKFRRLHAGDDGDYPDGKNGTDTSGADQGYCNIVYRNGGTPAQIEDFLRRFRYREKLDKHRTYVEMTVNKACDGTIEQYVPTPKPVVDRALARQSAETADALPNDVTALKAMIRDLQARNDDAGELEHLRADLAEARRTISGMVHTFLNPHMPQSDKITLIAALNLAEQKRQRGQVRADGSVELTAAEISEDWRPEPSAGESVQPTNSDGSKPRMKRQTVAPTITALAERGLIRATPRTAIKTRANGTTYRDRVWDITPPDKTSEILAAAAAWKPEEPKVRKTRTRDLACPQCGEVHPIKRVDYCEGCGSVRAERTITPTEQADTDEATTDDAYAAKNSGHIDSVAAPYVHKNSGHSRATLPLVAHARNGRSSPPPTAPPPGSSPAFDSVPF